MKVPPDNDWRMLRVRTSPLLPTKAPIMIPRGEEIMKPKNKIKVDFVFHY